MNYEECPNCFSSEIAQNGPWYCNDCGNVWNDDMEDDLSKALDPRNRLAVMSLEDAESEISNAVYKATELFERLEGAKLVDGNGHHMRQEVARFATKLLRKRWLK